MRKIKTVFLSLYSLFLSLFIKRDEKRIAFGSWAGELFIDNSKYLADYALEHYLKKGYVCYWVGNEEIREKIDPRLVFVKRNSVSSITTLLKCKYFFFSQIHTTDICAYNVYRDAILCFLDHGNTIKKCGADDPEYHGQYDVDRFSLIKRMLVKISGSIIPYNYIAVSSSDNIQTYVTGYKHLVSENTKFIKSGLPRNEILFKKDDSLRRELKEKYSRLIGFDLNNRVIMYLPTFRRKTEKVYSFTDLPFDQMERLVLLLKEHDAIILEKNHYVANKYDCNHAESAEYVIKVDAPVDLQEMLYFTDVQICDYSGCYLDYLILDRPLIHFLYDYVEYRDHDSGLYYDVDEFAAGAVATNVDEVIDDLTDILSSNDSYSAARKNVRDRFLEYEKGKASQIILGEILQ